MAYYSEAKDAIIYFLSWKALYEEKIAINPGSSDDATARIKLATENPFTCFLLQLQEGRMVLFPFLTA